MATANDQSWEQWVAAFNQPNAVAAPATTGGLAQANLNNVQALFDPRFGANEQIMAGAENAIAGGWGAGGFGQNQTNRLLDSERKANFLLGSQLLEPYLQRESAAGLQASDNAARLNQIAANGAQALQQLQLSEAGQTARLNSSQAAQLQRDVMAGQQAMQQLTLQEAGDTGRQRETIQGNLANTLLSGALSAAGKTGGGSAAPTATSYDPNNPPNRFNWASQINEINPGYRAPLPAQSFSLGSSSVDAILRRYGLLV